MTRETLLCCAKKSSIFTSLTECLRPPGGTTYLVYYATLVLDHKSGLFLATRLVSGTGWGRESNGPEVRDPLWTGTECLTVGENVKRRDVTTAEYRKLVDFCKTVLDVS